MPHASDPRPIERAASSASRIAPWLWGGFLAWGLTRFYFRHVPGQIHMTHEAYTYVYRALEFMDALAAGYWSPQWATHFRGGLGGPYFGFYQPGFFYVVAAFAAVLPLMTALAVAVWTFAVLGYGGTFALVRGRFGTAAGVLAGTTFMVATYVETELYVRGDLSEFAGMAMIAVTLAALFGWLEHGRPWRWAGLAAGAAAVVVCHPVAGLVGYATFAGTIVLWAASARSLARPRGAVLALLAGVGLAAFYWMPLWLEWQHTRGRHAGRGVFAVTRHFVDPLALIGLAEPPRHIPVALGWPTVALVCLATIALAWQWRGLSASARRLAIVLWAVGLVATVAVTAVSRPMWTSLPLVGLVQFPWRVFMVQAIALSALAGCLPGVPRLLLVAGAVALAGSLASVRTGFLLTFEHVDTAADLERLMVEPDGLGEWLPATARPIHPPRQWREPTITRGTVDDFERRTGYLRVRVSTLGPAVVTLPHYWFPLGWEATFLGRPVRLRPAHDGLMTAPLVGLGQSVLEVRFHTTPARRAGLVVSAVTAALLVAGVVLWSARTRRTAGVRDALVPPVRLD